MECIMIIIRFCGRVSNLLYLIISLGAMHNNYPEVPTRPSVKHEVFPTECEGEGSSRQEWCSVNLINSGKSPRVISGARLR